MDLKYPASTALKSWGETHATHPEIELDIRRVFQATMKNQEHNETYRNIMLGFLTEKPDPVHRRR